MGSMLGFAAILNTPRWLEAIKWSYEASSREWSAVFPRQLAAYPVYHLVYLKWMSYFFAFGVPLSTIAILNLLIGLQVGP